MKNVLVVSNYRAGRKTAVLNKKTLRKFLYKNSEDFIILDICDVDNIDTSDFDTIIAMGGDGTINKVLPLVINTDKTLGIIPCGTANLLAAKLGIPTNIKRALKILEKGNTQKIDVISINNTPCILRFGLGYDSDIIGKTPQSIKNKFGYFSYFIAGILFALRLIPQEYHIAYDDKEFDIKASCIIVANAANMYQNLVSIGNRCKLDDGLMDVFILKTKNPIVFFIEFLNILFKHRVDSSRAMYFKTSKLRIDNKWTMGHIDGEKKKFKDNFEFSVIEKSVNVLN